MEKFVWGEVIQRFMYDFDGKSCEIVKYHPHLFNEQGHSVYDSVTKKHVINYEKIQFHCEELHESTDTLEGLLVAWIARQHLGLNQHALVSGICRALCIKD